MAQEKIIVMTDEQLNKLLDEVAHKDSDTPNKGAAPRRYVYGLRGIRDLFGVSHTTAQKYKSTFLAPAISQRGRKIIVDAEKALQLFDQYNGVADQLNAPSAPKKSSRGIQLPCLKKKQYALLCECIRYRIADNTRERMDAEERGLGLAFYDKMEMRLTQLKNIFPPID